jgi:4-hydroxybenzoate polyprenyltransferase
MAFEGSLRKNAPTRQGTLKDYIAIARFDHMTKHVFIVPGIVLAYALQHDTQTYNLLFNVVVGLFSAVCIASANYVINEWLDREFDAAHPTKSQRSSVVSVLEPRFVYAEYVLLAVVGLVAAYLVGQLFLFTSIAFALSGLVYNISPVRTKDKPYLDVLSESINNPIRLLLGWSMVDGTTLPPSSVLLGYWMVGAFLMCAKRLGEFREIVSTSGAAVLGFYRRSFRYYTQESLMVSCFVYAMMSAFLLGVFLIKYRIEYILVFPCITGLFAVYLWLATRPGSVAQRPERLFHSRRLTAMLSATVIAFIVGTFVDMPFLSYFTSSSFIHVPASW